MTASPTRRRNRTIAAAMSGLLVLGAAPVVGYVGWDVLRNSKAGTEVKNYPVVAFPSTPTALLATVDDKQLITSLSVLVLAPGTGRGGTLVSIPTNASSAQSAEDDQLPIADSMINGGEEAVVADTESLSRVSIGTDGVLDATALTALLTPLEPVQVSLPNDVVAASDGASRTLFVAGANTLSAADAASVLLAHDQNQPESKRLPNVHAMWAGLAAAIGQGIGADAVTPLGPNGPADFDEFMRHFLAGPVQVFNDLSTVPITGSSNPTKIDVGRLDVSSVVMLMAGLAPSAMIAPKPTLNFRIENALTQADIDAAGLTGVTPVQVTLDMVQRLLFAEGNIISVSPEVYTLSSKQVPDETTVFSAGGLQSAELEVFTNTLGKVTFKDPAFQFPLVNVVIVVGKSYLADMLSRQTANGDTTNPEPTDSSLAPDATDATGTDTVDSASASTVSS
jgi:hypothetical protein